MNDNNKIEYDDLSDEYLKNLLPEDGLLNDILGDDFEDDDCQNDFCDDECCEHHHNEGNNEFKNMNLDDVDVKKEIDNLVKKLSSVKVDEDIIIAVSNSYISKYYINPKLEKNLPKEVKDDLKALLVTITEKNGGIIEMHYVDSEMEIYLNTYSLEDDFLYDEIGAKSDISKLEIQYREMFEQMAAVCKISLRDLFEDKKNK